MYGKLGSTAVLAAPTGALAAGGMHALWWAVAASTLVAAALAAARLLPRRER